MKKNKFKSIIESAVFTALICIGAMSCSYDDFVSNEFDYTAVYFPKAQIDRTFLIGEGMRIGVGAVLGGRLSNTENVEITFSLDDNLVTDAGLDVLPTSHYQLVDANGNPVTDKITIPAGKVQGFVYVKADSLNLLSDAASLGNNYALGFHIESVVRADSILQNLESTLITFSYINKLYGNYVQQGQYVKTTGGVNETIAYPAGITDVVEIVTSSPNSAIVNGLAEFRLSNHKMEIVIASDNTITIQSVAGAVPVVDNGGSFYDPETRNITLNYSFDFNGSSYTATDVLDFRNRVVDGVNQFDYNQ